MKRQERGRRFRLERLRLGLTQPEVAQLASQYIQQTIGVQLKREIDYRTVRDYEKGTTPANGDFWAAMWSIGMNVPYIFGFEDIPAKNRERIDALDQELGRLDDDKVDALLHFIKVLKN